MRSLLILAVVALSWAAVILADEPSGIGATKIRFYTGNLSVGYFMEYWGTGKPGPGDAATPEFCRQMKEVGVSAVCDYLAWCLAEPQPGRWDWSIYDKNEQALHANGLQYNVFCWLHFPPKWFMETPEYVPYRCVEHDQTIQQTSIWAPGTLRIYERFYKELSDHFGEKIDFLRLATPADYGEIGYPAGMTNWLVKQEHVHAGFWCNDRYARADFKSVMKKRYGTASKLNQSWGTKFKSFEAIEFPPMAKNRSKLKEPLNMTPGERRWILDFIGWYYDSQAEFARKAIEIVRKHFPGKEIIMSMGYGSQKTVYGNDDVGIARMCRDMKVACQTPGNIPYFCMKSLASPCKLYGVPYFTEPPANVGRNEQVNRIWADTSCGTQTFFDYPGNLTGAKDVFEKYGGYLDGKQAIVDVAVFFPTVDHRLRDEDWPARTMAGANMLREFLDYDLVDERMIRDGALDRYKMLVMYDGNIIAETTLSALDKWLAGGGILLIKGFGPIVNVDGEPWQSVKFSPLVIGGVVESPDVVTTTRKNVGEGLIIAALQKDGNDMRFAEHVAGIARDLSKHLRGRKNVSLIDDTTDGVSGTLFPDRILYLNPTDRAIEKMVNLRESDFPAGSQTGRPSLWSHTLRLEPHSIQSIELK